MYEIEERKGLLIKSHGYLPHSLTLLSEAFS